MFCYKTDGVVRAVSRAGAEAPGLGTCAEALSLSLLRRAPRRDTWLGMTALNFSQYRNSEIL